MNIDEVAEQRQSHQRNAQRQFSLARQAKLAYKAFQDRQGLTICGMPWEELCPLTQEAWKAAVSWVLQTAECPIHCEAMVCEECQQAKQNKDPDAR